MPNIIRHKRSSTSGVVPVASGLSQGELAINIADGKLYTKNNANSVINLGVTSISGTSITPASGYLQTIEFNNTGDPDLSARQLAWNNSEGTLALALSDNYEMFLGGELHYRVRNNTGSPILAGTAVYATGLTPGGNNRIEVAPNVADGSIREVRFMGLMTEDCNTGVNGFTTHFGYIRNIDTRGDASANGTTNKLWASGEPSWSEGDILYVHPTVAGKLTKIEPKHSISVAIILNRHQNQGKLFVRPTSYGHLNDNHDVSVSGATNGQFLQYNSSTDYWVPSSSGNFTNLTINNSPVVTGGGTSGYLPKFNSSQGVANSLVFDNGTNIGIGTTSPQALLHVNGQAYLQSLNLTGGTADRILATDTNKNVVGLNTSTYPTLTELSWVKGATSSIQTQLNNRMLLANGSSADINSISNGITRVYPTGNGPDGGGTHVTAFTSMQDTSNNYGWQIAGYSNAFYFRHKGTTFDPWYRMWTNYDFTSSNITNWNTAYGWGNHSSAGYQSASTSLTTSTNFGGDVSGAYNNIVVADDSHNHIISNVDGLQSVLDLKSPLSSPAFTGTPTAPTAAGGTNTTQIATTAFVRTEISSLVDAAPGTLDTLNELAAALGDDPNFATTVTNSIATKQATITGGASTITSSNLTINRALISDSNGKVAVSDITNTELNYLDNASSNIQTQINTKIAYGEYSQSNPVFGQKGIKQSIADNVLYSAADRFEFYIDNVLQSSNTLFNLSYDQSGVTFLPNTTKVFRLVFNTKGNSTTGITHPEGNVYLSFYYLSGPGSVSGRVKDKDNVWRNITNWTNVSTNPSFAVWRGTVPGNVYVVEMELTVVAGSTATVGPDATWCNQIEYVMDRPGQFELGVLNKAQDTTLWRNINFKNNSNTTTLSLTSAGNINLTSSTASRILSTDGSKNIVALDTATYPSLTELSYVKGATSNIQTQLNSKAGGTGTTGKIPKWSSTTALADSIMSESSTIVNIAGSLHGTSDDTYLSFDAGSRRIGITKKGGFTGKFTYGSTSSFAIAQSNSGTIEATNTFTDRLVLDSNGNVGIGTATPGSKLEVNGEIAAGGTSAFTFAGNAWGYDKIIFRKDVNNKITTDSSGNYNWLVAGRNWTLSDVGNVGIGTTVPDAKLVVSSSTDANSVLWERGGASGTVFGHYFRSTANNTTTFKKAGIVFENGTDGYSNGKLHILNRGGIDDTNATVANAARITVLNNGDVGIGTTAPSDKLNVIGNISAGTISNTKGNFIAYGSAGQPTLLFEGFGSDGTARISTNSGGNRQLKIENDGAGTTLGVYIEGDVGIGTTTPGYKLQVNGSFAASTKSFRINHPSKKDHSLEYGSLESPYHGVRLTGRGKVIKGVGVVSLPDYLKDLIHDDDTLNIQITNIKHGKTIYIDKIDLQNDQFIVKVDRAKSLGELQFCWTLSGVRKDVDHLVVEKEN